MFIKISGTIAFYTDLQISNLYCQTKLIRAFLLNSTVDYSPEVHFPFTYVTQHIFSPEYYVYHTNKRSFRHAKFLPFHDT